MQCVKGEEKWIQRERNFPLCVPRNKARKNKSERDQTVLKLNRKKHKKIIVLLVCTLRYCGCILKIRKCRGNHLKTPKKVKQASNNWKLFREGVVSEQLRSQKRSDNRLTWLSSYRRRNWTSSNETDSRRRSSKQTASRAPPCRSRRSYIISKVAVVVVVVVDAIVIA